MLLNGFSVVNQVIDDSPVSDEVFIDKLRKLTNLVGDVYFDGKLVFSSMVSFSEIMGNLIASFRGQFAIDTDMLISQIIIRVHQADVDDEILNSVTELNEFIEAGDQTASLFARVTTLYPSVSTKNHVPNSIISWQRTNRLHQSVFDDLPNHPSIVVDP